MFNTNAVIATIKSILHTSGKVNRDLADNTARQIAEFMCENEAHLLLAYDSSDLFDIAESFTRDYLSEVK